jgi:hypothetical protein
MRNEFGSVPARFNADILNNTEDDADAIIDSIHTQFGKRDAYYEFYKHHCAKFGDCEVDFHCFCSFYTLHEAKHTSSRQTVGLSHKITVVNEHGFITSTPQDFTLQNVSSILLFCEC